MIKTRFAPSPTGYLHIGGVRTALFAWAFAKKHNGKFILRIEDTDATRSSQESLQTILDGMKWLNLDYDEGPIFQSKRIKRYQEVIQNLLDSGNAYYCYCTKEELLQKKKLAENNGQYFIYDGKYRPEKNKILPKIPKNINPVIRFKMPKTGYTQFNDLVKGNTCFENAKLEDFIIAREDGTPTYNLCVVVDDYDMQITHIIRGDDHVNNTPKQINILSAMNANIPLYAHVPMILNENGTKMSKRNDAVSITDYQKIGILPQAMLNYLARLGWGHKDIEIFSQQEFIKLFNLKDISPSPSRFNNEKLLWVNSYYINNLNINYLSDLVIKNLNAMGIKQINNPNINEVLKLIRNRASTINALTYESIYFYKKLNPTKEEINKFATDEGKALVKQYATNHLEKIKQWSSDNIKETFKEFCSKNNIKMGDLGMPLRIIVCGTSKTPAINDVIFLIGKNEVLKRIFTN